MQITPRKYELFHEVRPDHPTLLCTHVWRDSRTLCSVSTILQHSCAQAGIQGHLAVGNLKSVPSLRHPASRSTLSTCGGRSGVGVGVRVAGGPLADTCSIRIHACGCRGGKKKKRTSWVSGTGMTAAARALASSLTVPRDIRLGQPSSHEAPRVKLHAPPPATVLSMETLQA